MTKHGFCGKNNQKNYCDTKHSDVFKAPNNISLTSTPTMFKAYGTKLNRGGGNNNAPISYAPVQLYHSWYQTKEDRVRLCVTWYKSESCRNVKQHLIFTSSFPNFYWYYGNWNSGYLYHKDAIVRYNSIYYICIKDHTSESSSKHPTNTTYWQRKGMPDLVNWFSATAANGVGVPDKADYIENFSISEGSLYYDYRDDRYEGMYCFYSATYTDSYGDTSYMYNYTSKINFNRLNTYPSVTYDSSTNRIQLSSSYSGKFLMEFYRSGYNPTGYSESVRNEFFLTSIASLEGGLSGYYYIDYNTLNRWRKNKTYTVGIQYLDTQNRNVLYNAINDAIYEVNQIMSEFGITFKKIATTSYADTTGDITFICGSHYDLWGYEPSFEDGWYNGTWSTDIDYDGYIEGATIKLRNDGEWHCTYRSVALEELLQSMGAGYDQIEYLDNTVHSEFIYLDKPDYVTTVDKNILRITYSDNIDADMSAEDVAVQINPTNGATNISNNQKLSFLTGGCTYYIKVYVVNSSGKLSYPTSLTIAVPLKIRPSDFRWTYPKTSGGNFNLTASEWNSFTSKINEFRDYCNLSTYIFTTAYTGNTFTAAMYRQARTAIQAIDGYGTYIPYVYSGDDITADMMNILVSELNNIP